MRQIYLFYIVKLRKKLKFYQALFCIKKIKYCYLVYCIKQILNCLIYSFILFFFLRNSLYFEKNFYLKNLIISTVSFLSTISSSKTTKSFIKEFESQYRLSSYSYFTFFFNTIIVQAMSDLLFEVSSLIPILLIVIAISPDSLIYCVFAIFFGIMCKCNNIIYYVLKNSKVKRNIFVILLKKITNYLITAIILLLSFNIIGSALVILKILLTSMHYDESILLNQLFFSTLTTINKIRNIYINNQNVMLFYFMMIVTLPIFDNFYRYFLYWENIKQYSHKKIVDKERLYYDIDFPILKKINLKKLDIFWIQLVKNYEILVWLIIEVILLANIKNIYGRVLFIFWFFFLVNSNYIRSIFFKNIEIFGKYDVINDLFYFRLAGRNIKQVYNMRVKLLKKITIMGTLLQQSIVIIYTSIFIHNLFLNIFTICITTLLLIPMHNLNLKLVTFSSFFTFSNDIKKNVIISESDEDEFLEEKLQNLFKLPFTLIPMIILIVDYIYSFINFYNLLIILFLFLVLAIIINSQIISFIRNAGESLEKNNISI